MYILYRVADDFKDAKPTPGKNYDTFCKGINLKKDRERERNR